MSAYHENALTPGSTLADYTVDSVLGQGGFSITYLAHDNALGADVAIKEYLPQEIATRDPRSVRVIPHANKDAIRHYQWGLNNFVNEARALARFKHPNIVRVLRFIEANGTAYTVMEYEQGQTLAQYLKEQGQRLDESALLRIVMPILNGLHAVHELGLLHLDIKPENIYLRRDGSPMLIDFGSARHAMTESRPTGHITLTHGYAPVEQYPDKGKLGPWSDVYALGATMYRCVTGKRPDDALERYRAVLDYKTDPLRPAVKAGAGRFQPVILECIDRAMQIHAKDRPQSAREFQDELLGRGKSARAASVAPPVSRPPAAATGRAPTRGIGRAIRATIVLMLLAGSGVAGWWFWSDISYAWRKLARIMASSPVQTPEARPAPRPAVPHSQPTAAPAPRAAAAPASPPPVSGMRALPTKAGAVLSGHTDWIQAIAFAPDGTQLATASNDRTIRIWDVAGRNAVAVLHHEYGANALSYAPDGRTLASVGTDGVVRLWAVGDARPAARLEASGYPLYGVAYARDGRTLAAGGRDRMVYVWNLGDGSRRVLDGHTDTINALVFRPDGKAVVSAGADRMIRLWDLASGQELRQFPGHKDPILTLAFSSDGRWLASGDAGDTIRVWDMRALSHLHTLTDVPEAVLSLAFAPDGSWLAAGSADRTVYFFDVETGRLVQTLRGHKDYVQALAVSPDSRWLASGGRDRVVRLWRP